METKHVLMRFFSEKSYLEQFLQGSIYMNSMGYFWNENAMEAAMRKKREILKKNPCLNPDKIYIPLENKAPAGQMDMLEGTIATVDRFDAGFDEKFANMQLTDVGLRAKGYQYCNLCCFYRYDVGLNDDVSDEIKKFGNYVAVIRNEQEFIRRIEEAVRASNFDFVCGNVEYKTIQKAGKTVAIGHHAVFKSDDIRIVDITSEEYKDKFLDRRDSFCKHIKYKNQKEWRIALYRGEKSTAAYRLELGDISDLVIWAPVDKMDKLFLER